MKTTIASYINYTLIGRFVYCPRLAESKRKPKLHAFFWQYLQLDPTNSVYDVQHVHQKKSFRRSVKPWCTLADTLENHRCHGPKRCPVIFLTPSIKYVYGTFFWRA